MPPLAWSPDPAPARRPLRFELVFVALVAFAVLAPGIWKYSLLDPWETHYGEVARMMLQNDDFVHTQWPQDGEGFRSKPVLMFWMMAAGLTVADVADGGGYSGEMVAGERTMLGMRLPFVVSAVCGLMLLWWMLARLVSRRMAWLGLLTVGSTPIFCMIARQAIPDMPLAASTLGALSLFVMAVEDGDRPISTLGYLGRRRRIRIDARHVVLGIAGGFVLLQAAYYAYYFTVSPQLGVRGRVLSPVYWLPALMVLLLGAQSRDGWLILRLPFVLAGGLISRAVGAPAPAPLPPSGSRSRWRRAMDTLARWERHSLDRYLVRALPLVLLAGLVAANLATRVRPPQNLAGIVVIAALAAVWGQVVRARGWAGTDRLAGRLLAMAPITTMRQLYLLGMYFLLGVGVLAKGPPGLTVVASVAGLHVLTGHRWRALWDGAFELKRGILLAVAVAIPWHIAMFFKEGPRFLDEYLFQHILNRAGDGGVDKSWATFEHYTSQIGHGMWLWAALLPAAISATLLRVRTDSREGRVRFLVGLWAIAAVAVFCLVQTKFHHYILPAIPPLALLVAFLLDDVWTRRDRLHPLFAALGIGIVLLVTRDLMFEPERWIEMFVFRYDRPWPGGPPYAIDPSDGFLGLGLAAAIAIAVMATRFARAGVLLACATGLAICVWGLQVYMPLAGKHWGMREAVRTYYEQRTIYGEKLVYFGVAQLADHWRDVRDAWTFPTFIPDALQLGQPMTLDLQVNKAGDERITERQMTLVGRVTAIGAHDVTVTLDPGERRKLDPWIADGARAASAPRGPRSEPVRGRRPVRAVDADRLIAWQLYWRGENFWSGDEIWGWLPEMRTAFVNTNNQEFVKYINDRTRTPLGRRYFVITGATQITGIKGSLPTSRARDSFEVLDTTSNKFSLGAFWL